MTDTFEQMVDKAAKRAFFSMNNIMHDHEMHWSKANQAIWIDTQRDALTAIGLGPDKVIMPRKLTGELLDVILKSLTNSTVKHPKAKAWDFSYTYTRLVDHVSNPNFAEEDRTDD